ncbi:MAG: glycosyltransferase family 39 protein, partial [Holophagales bacterium]|nr:glycosyltransferase family 39 protein [Holophagales bacterium]
EPSLWLDEILHAEKTRALAEEAGSRPWTRWLRELSSERENGPLYYAVQVLALGLAGGEVAARLAPALAGVAAVAVLFFVGSSPPAGPRVALAASALLAASPLHVYYSREGRPYAAVMLAATLLLLLAARERWRGSAVAGYMLCLGTACLGAVAAPLLIATGMLAAASWLLWRRHGHLVPASGLGLLTLALLFPRVQGLSQVTGTAVPAARHGGDLEITRALSVQGLDRLLASLTVSGLDSGSATWLSVLLSTLAVWGAVCLVARRPRAALWGIGLAVLPILGWLALLQLYGHWYNVRYTSSGLPAFLLLVAVGLVDTVERLSALPERFGRRTPGWMPFLLLGLCLVPLLAPAWGAARTEPWQKPDWRGLAGLLDTLAVPGEPLIARDPWSEACLRHYLRQRGSAIEVHGVNYDVERAKELLTLYPRAWTAAAGYRKAEWFQPLLEGLDAIYRGQLANVRLFYAPDFATLFSDPLRGDPSGGEGLAAILDHFGEGEGQEFGPSPLLLGGGWSAAEREPSGTTFRWAAAERAELALPAPGGGGGAGDDVSGPRRRVLRFRLRPFPSPDLGPQVVRVEVNGQLLEELELEERWAEVETRPYPSNRTVDLVILTFAWQQSPRALDPSSADGRRLAVAFDSASSAPAPPA